MLEELSGKISLQLDDLVDEMQGVFEKNVPTYAGLPPSVKADIRRLVAELIKQTTRYMAGAGLSHEELYAFARRVGRNRTLQNLPLGDLVKLLYLAETVIWEGLLPDMGEGRLSPRELVSFLRLQGEMNANLVSALSASYLEVKDQMIGRQLRELHGLLEVGRTIISTTDPERVFLQILEVAAGIIRSPMGAVYLLEEGGGEIRLVAQIGLAPPWVKGRRVELGRSLLSQAIGAGAPVGGVDEGLRGLALPVPLRGGRVRSAVSCPVMGNEGPLGGLELYDTRPRTYDRLDMALLAAFAPQAGVAIENARLFDMERRRSRQMAMMKELAEESASAVGFNQAMSIVVRKMAEVAGVEKCLLYIYHPTEDQLEFAWGHGLPAPVNQRLRGTRRRPHDVDEMTFRAVSEREAVLVEDVLTDPRVDRDHLKPFKLASCLALPLVSEGRTVGVMYLGDSRRRRTFSEEDMEMIRSMASQATVAILQAQLRERIRIRERRLQELEASERIFRERERSEAIVAANPDAIMVVNRERNITLFNPAAAELFGWREEEALGRHVHEVLYGEENPPEESCGREGCPVEASFRGEIPALTEMEYQRKNGEKVWISGSFSVIRNRKRQIESVICVFRDITEQKRLQHMALVEKELNIASSIQEALLPEGALENEVVKVVAHMEQARIVGGDWYDYWEEDGELNIVVGDAAGSGVPAALLSTLAMSAIRAESGYGLDMAEVLRKANLAIYPHRLDDKFVTIFYGRLDLESLVLRYVNAGHNDPYVIRGGGEVIPVPSEKRSILGAFEELDVRVEEVRLEPGDRLFLYTDGVVDCRDARRRQFGEKRLRRFLKRSGSREAEAFLQDLVGILRSFCGGRMEDDFTLLLCDIKRR